MSKQNYMEKFDAWFTDRLREYENDADAGTFSKDVKDKILESFRNGQRSARRSPKENEATSEGK